MGVVQNQLCGRWNRIEGVDSYPAAYREYVEAIWELQEEGVPSIQARIADWLGLSRPSVSQMVRRMEEDGLVEVGETVLLTDEGRHLAEVVVRRHRLSERFLSEVLGLPWVKVHEEASVWEHMISADVEAAMWRALDDPKTCPHGNPIPGAGYRPPPMHPLAELDVGKAGPLERISEELELEQETMDFLDRAGIRPGARMEVVEVLGGDSFLVSVGASDPIEVPARLAERLFVEREP